MNLQKDFKERWNRGEDNPCQGDNHIFDKYQDGHCDICFFCGDHDISEYGDCSKCPASRYETGVDLEFYEGN